MEIYSLMYSLWAISQGNFMALESILAYFKNVQNLLKDLSAGDQEADSIEKREIILKNIFSEIDGYEYRLCCHHDGSLLVEQLLPIASNLQLRIFLSRLVGCFVKLMTNRYASHVIETAFTTLIIQKPVEEVENDLVPRTKDLIKSFLSEIQYQLEDLLFDTFSSKVLRKVIPPLKSSYADLLDEFQVSFKAIEFEQLAKDPCGTLVLQDFISCGIEIDHEGYDLLSFSSDKNSSRVVETLITKEGAEGIWKKHFKGKVSSLLNRDSNFVLQKLISESKKSKTLCNIIEELKDQLENILFYPGVLFKLCEKAVISDFKEIQKPLKKEIISQLFPELDLLSILSLKSDNPKPLGCQIASCLLDFKDNKAIIDQIFNLSNQSFIKLSTDKFSSRLLEKFFAQNKSPITKFVKKIEGKMIQMACDPNASHILEQIFELSTTESKTLIANELAPRKKSLIENRYGSIVWNKLRMEEFLHNRERWINYGEHLKKRKLLLEGFLEEDNAISTRSGKRSKNK
jgi:hypothetical protein